MSGPIFVIEVPFVFGPIADSPNARRLGSYERSIAVTFASARRAHGDTAALKLTSPSPPPAHLVADLVPYNVELSSVPFYSRPPATFWRHFNSSLYLLDLIAHYATAPPSLPIVFMDPDCVVLSDISGSVPDSGEVGIYGLGDRPAEEPDNGLNRLESARLHHDLDPDLPADELPIPVGGEFLAVHPAAFSSLSGHCRRAWLYSLERFEHNLEPKFNTEEHVLAFAARHVRSVQTDCIRRVWTSHKFRDVRASDLGLAVWHLPAEKGRGLDVLYRRAVEQDSWFWTSSEAEFRRRAGRVVGIPKRGARRTITDGVRSALSAAAGVVRR